MAATTAAMAPAISLEEARLGDLGAWGKIKEEILAGKDANEAEEGGGGGGEGGGREDSGKKGLSGGDEEVKG